MYNNRQMQLFRKIHLFLKEPHLRFFSIAFIMIVHANFSDGFDAVCCCKLGKLLQIVRRLRAFCLRMDADRSIQQISVLLCQLDAGTGILQIAGSQHGM